MRIVDIEAYHAAVEVSADDCARLAEACTLAVEALSSDDQRRIDVACRRDKPKMRAVAAAPTVTTTDRAGLACENRRENQQSRCRRATCCGAATA